MKITPVHTRIINKVVQIYGFKDIDDNKTFIDKTQCEKAMSELAVLKPQIVGMFTKEFTRKLRQDEMPNKKHSITYLRQLLRPIRKGVYARRVYRYCNIKKRSKCHLEYCLI